MTHIVGTVCDGCGDLKSTRKLAFNTEDQFPPATWYSICEWVDDGVAGHIEFHACSVDCLKGVSSYIKDLRKQHKKAEHKAEKDDLKDIDAYCVMCKDKYKMVDAFIRVSDSGRRMAAGKCERCGGKVNRILGKVQ